MQGFPEDWTKPAENVARPGHRWSLVGSAVSVPVAAWIGERLSRPGTYDLERDGVFPQTGMLPRAARFDGRRRHRVEIGPDPVGRRSEALTSFLRHEGQLLSPRATAGFLSRTRVATLRFAPGFISAVEAHLAAVTAAEPTPARRMTRVA